MKRLILVSCSLLFILGGAICWLLQDGRRERGRGADHAADRGEELLVYCAAGFRKPMVDIARKYEVKFGVPIHLQFGGSGALMSQLELAGGDVFLPADETYLERIRAQGGVREQFLIVRLIAGLVVAEGNPKKLRTLEDLSRAGLRISLGDQSTSIGRHTWDVFRELGISDKMKARVLVTKPTVNHLVEDVATGAVDVAIAWAAVAHDYRGVEWVALPEFSQRVKVAGIGVLASSERRLRALHFAEFVSAPESGRKVFQEMGFICLPSPSRPD